MPKTNDLFSTRKSLDEICEVPEKIISVYSLEQHVWADGHSAEARQLRLPEQQTIEEFQIDPVRPFLNDVFRNLAAPYKPERRENPIGQGYWIQAEFGSGKSHLLCFLSALALGDKQAWQAVQRKEQQAGRGRRESLYRFWEEGLEAKSQGSSKGILVVVKTLVGTGGGTVGLAEERRGRLVDYILDAVKEQLQVELGRNLSLYPAEILADRLLSEDLDRYRNDLRKFLRDPRFFIDEQTEDVNGFIAELQQNRSPEYKRSLGNRLWLFYDEYLKVKPHVAAETEDILKHMVDTVLAEGYSGLLLVLDEVSLFMKNRTSEQQVDDEQTLVVLANRLAKVHNLPVWTVCAAQQAIESKMAGVKNIIADDRLKLVKLLESDKDYYDIVLARVRTIKDPAAITNYYNHYRRGFTWPNSIGPEQFAHFFPFHQPAVEVLRAITFELTTARSAIHFMHQTLKHQVTQQGRELIRLWELFDEAVRYEEDPSGVHAGLVAIKTKKETEYRAYEVCKRQVESQTKGALKVYREKAIKVLQTLFLYHVARTRQQGLTPEEIANSVMLPRGEDSAPDENNQHYESLTETLNRELRQVVVKHDEDKRPHYLFEPIVTGVDPREEFRRARDEAEADAKSLEEAWLQLLALDEWPVRTRQITLDLSGGNQSLFRAIAPTTPQRSLWGDDQSLELVWQGRQVAGRLGMRDLARVSAESVALPAIDTDQSDYDFAVYISTRPASTEAVNKLLDQYRDPRLLLWTPAELTPEEHARLVDFAAYRKLVGTWGGKETEDALTIISWVSNNLQTEMAKLYGIVTSSYGRGRVDARDNAQMEFHVAGELTSILNPLVSRVLSAVYVSYDIGFEQFIFRKEEAVKVINGIVRAGSIPKGAKPNQNISAAQNFGFGLKIMKKTAERDLNVADNVYVQDLWQFIDSRLSDPGQAMRLETLYKNFMGLGGPKPYGLSRAMVQLYLLCLVRQGKIRVSLGPRSGLAIQQLDYSNLAEADFSARVLDALTEVHKLEKPANWDVLRPYAEKLLERPLPPTHDDAAITGHRQDLQALFAKEREDAARLLSKARDLFEALGVENPYQREVSQAAQLFATPVGGGNDIDQILHALKQAFNYTAFDAGEPNPREVDDLAVRLKNYHAVQRWVSFEADLRAAAAYARLALPDRTEFQATRAAQAAVQAKLAKLQPYLDSDVKLRTELVGTVPAEPGEKGTIGALIREYTLIYTQLHDAVVDRMEAARRDLAGLQRSPEFQALEALEGIQALEDPVAAGLRQRWEAVAQGLFSAPGASKDAIERALRRGPVYESGLTFDNAQTHVDTAQQAVQAARQELAAALDRKLQVFLNAAVRDRLAQGQAEPAIAALLSCNTLDGLRAYIVPALQPAARGTMHDGGEHLVGLINRYLKRLVVRPVRLADFKPAQRTVEREQIPEVVRDFETFLRLQFDALGSDDGTLPMLQFE